MVEKRYYSSLDFGTKLKVMEWLKKNEERFAETSYIKIAKIGEEELQIPLSDSTIRGISQTVGLKHIRGNREEREKKDKEKIILRALAEIYSHISCKMPKELDELVGKLGTDNGGDV